jgi:hypothetical protein
VPTKRRKLTPERISLTPAAITAWKAGDSTGLRQALGIKPWQPMPWPMRLPLGVDPYCPPSEADDAWVRAIEWQRALYEAAGAPPRRLRYADKA